MVNLPIPGALAPPGGEDWWDWNGPAGPPAGLLLQDDRMNMKIEKNKVTEMSVDANLFIQ